MENIAEAKDKVGKYSITGTDVQHPPGGFGVFLYCMELCFGCKMNFVVSII